MPKFTVLVAGGLSSRIAAQQAAEATWPAVAEHVLLVEQDKPSVKTLLEMASEKAGPDGVVCLVNRDVQLKPVVTCCIDVAQRQRLGREWGCTSYRHETEGDRFLGVIGWGLDFFVWTVPVLERMTREMSPYFTTGRCLWDNWVNGWSAHNLPRSHWFDITSWVGVIHPKHESAARENAYPEEQAKALGVAVEQYKSGMTSTVYPPR